MWLREKPCILSARQVISVRLDPILLIKELMNAHGVNALLLTPPYDDIAQFDERLRAQLFNNYDYHEITQRLESICAPSVVYMVEDQFKIHYVIIRLPTSPGAEMAFLFIGPYLTEASDALLEGHIQAGDMALEQVAALRAYYSGIPQITILDAMEAEIIILAKHLLGSEDFTIDGISLRFHDIDGSAQVSPQQDEVIHMEMIEERYQVEDDLLKAIELGDHQQALKHLSAFNRFRIETRHADVLRDRKNYFITSNSLMRKAVQRADVHPAHIDSISSYFARKIEAARSTDDLTQIMNEMLRKYCLLVKNHSLRSYSRPVQNVLNYIDFNYTEQLTLAMLSGLAGISASYLSTQFKKELGISVIDYINQSRVQHAQRLLVTTSLPINKISEMIGFLDENYFARTFKRHTQKSPSEYRKLFK